MLVVVVELSKSGRKGRVLVSEVIRSEFNKKLRIGRLRSGRGQRLGWLRSRSYALFIGCPLLAGLRVLVFGPPRSGVSCLLLECTLLGG